MFPVTNVDLVIEYHLIKSNIYRNFGDILVSDASRLFKNRTELDKIAQNYIIASIRDGIVKEVRINQLIRVAH